MRHLFPMKCLRASSQSLSSASKPSIQDRCFREMDYLMKLWTRIPIRSSSEKAPSDQRPFSISRNETYPEYHYLWTSRLHRNVFHRNVDGLFTGLTRYAEQLAVEDLFPNQPISEFVAGHHKIFHLVIEACRTGNFDVLARASLNPATFDLHKEELRKLTAKQRMGLEVTSDDFLGFDGFVSKFNPGQLRGLEEPKVCFFAHSPEFINHDATKRKISRTHYKYSTTLIALRKKQMLFKLVKPLPQNNSQDGLLLRVPPSYQFISPRYVIVRIDVCQEVIKAIKLELEDEVKLYDIHIHSF